MKLKLLAILIATTLIFNAESCKVLQGATAKVCTITITQVCPSLQHLLELGAVIKVEPTSQAGKYLISAKGISAIICDAAGIICPAVLDALNKGQAVTITPVKTSSNKVKAIGNQIEVIITYK